MESKEKEILSIPYAYYFRCIYEYFGDSKVNEDQLKNFLVKWNVPKWMRIKLIEGLVYLEYLIKEESLYYCNRKMLNGVSVNNIILMGRIKVKQKPERYKQIS